MGINPTETQPFMDTRRELTRFWGKDRGESLNLTLILFKWKRNSYAIYEDIKVDLNNVNERKGKWNCSSLGLTLSKEKLMPFVFVE